MNSPLTLRANSPLLKNLHFAPYRYRNAERYAQPFVPQEGQSTRQVKTPWGAILTAQPGDYIVRDAENPEDVWVVEKEIFEATYRPTERGTYVKTTQVLLAPLSEIASEDAEIVIETIEGAITVQAGDFYLAKGVQGEIWPVPKEKIGTEFHPAD